ncbi:MAG: hypothetical protein ABIH49_00120 [archaeon]
MKKEDIQFLEQLTGTLKESEEKLEEYYVNKDSDGFENMKKFMLKIQNKIAEVLR